jgi:hypothetical protein
VQRRLQAKVDALHGSTVSAEDGIPFTSPSPVEMNGASSAEEGLPVLNGSSSHQMLSQTNGSAANVKALESSHSGSHHVIINGMGSVSASKSAQELGRMTSQEKSGSQRLLQYGSTSHLLPDPPQALQTLPVSYAPGSLSTDAQQGSRPNSAAVAGLQPQLQQGNSGGVGTHWQELHGAPGSGNAGHSYVDQPGSQAPGIGIQQHGSTVLGGTPSQSAMEQGPTLLQVHVQPGAAVQPAWTQGAPQEASSGVAPAIPGAPLVSAQKAVGESVDQGSTLHEGQPHTWQKQRQQQQHQQSPPAVTLVASTSVTLLPSLSSNSSNGSSPQISSSVPPVQ